MRCHLMIVHSKSLDSKSKLLLLAQLEASEESSSEQSGASEAGKYAHGCSFIFFCAHTHTQTNTYTHKQTDSHTRTHTLSHSHTQSHTHTLPALLLQLTKVVLNLDRKAAAEKARFLHLLHAGVRAECASDAETKPKLGNYRSPPTKLTSDSSPSTPPDATDGQGAHCPSRANLGLSADRCVMASGSEAGNTDGGGGVALLDLECKGLPTPDIQQSPVDDAMPAAEAPPASPGTPPCGEVPSLRPQEKIVAWLLQVGM